MNNHHYLFIDGIDSRPSDIPYEEYVECVFPLVRAVYEINTEVLSRIKDRNKGRLQVVLLSRPDIFLRAGLSNPGSKINDNAVFLNWRFFKEEHHLGSARLYRQAEFSEFDVIIEKQYNEVVANLNRIRYSNYCCFGKNAKHHPAWRTYENEKL